MPYTPPGTPPNPTRCAPYTVSTLARSFRRCRAASGGAVAEKRGCMGMGIGIGIDIDIDIDIGIGIDIEMLIATGIDLY